MRRNLAVAEALTARGESTALLVAGAREAGSWTLPPHVEVLTVPALSKSPDGAYLPRSLKVSLETLVELRAAIIKAALDAYEPDVFVIDKLPLGVAGELAPTLSMLGERAGTQFVLGMREVLDDPATVLREWRRSGSEAAVRDHFDEVWVYGDPTVYDPIAEYRLGAAMREKVRYTGYVTHAPYTTPSARASSRPPFALCLLGGGQDGIALARAFALAPLPADTHGLIVTGPLMRPRDREAIHALAAANPRMHVRGFELQPQRLIAEARCVVAMGGYNTVCELLAARKRALIVPRIKPRTEQLIRARRMAELGLVDMLHPDDLTPQAIGRWIAAAEGTEPADFDGVALDGCERLPALLDDLLARRDEPPAAVSLVAS